MALSEQEKIVSGLETSIRMEIDGKAFYLKASADSTNEAGKKLLRQLAGEEDDHLQLFQQIYNALRKQQSWPDIEIKPSVRVKTHFSRNEQTAGKVASAPSNEIDAVKTALAMENQSIDFYESRRKDAAYGSEIDFYKALAEQERGHQLVLLDYLEFLQDPSTYFIKKEHHSLDGG